MNATPWIVGLIALIVIGGGAYALSMPKADVMMKDDGAMMEKDGAMEGDAMMEKENDSMMDDSAMMQKGSYEAYSADKLALADKGDVVLFFRASWCPTCRSLDADIRSHLGDIPEGVTILDVNYDTATALKQKYGVTMQHTLVQVAADGSLIAKWTGSPTLAALAAKIK